MRILIFTCFFILGLSAGINAQETTELITKSIKGGNAANLSTHFNSTLDISLPDMEQTMSKSHAAQVMKDFFSAHPPKSYKVNHVGSSREATKYMIGTYISGSTTYKTYALLKLKEGKYLIVQLQFEKE